MPPLGQTPVTFSFGENWQNYRTQLRPEDIASAKHSLRDWLGNEDVSARSVIDIGSGSGLSATALWEMGCASLRSFDYDDHSVAATAAAHKSAESPEGWTNSAGSILDLDFVGSLGKFDLVHSWGVLHHTGQLWKALENAISLVKPGGRLFISLYTAGPAYAQSLALKERFNRSSEREKKRMIQRYAEENGFLMDGKNAEELKSQKRERGMSVYYDIVDWLGGLPYEVAFPSEVIAAAAGFGLEPRRVLQRGDGGCTEYLFSRVEKEPSSSDTFQWARAEDRIYEARSFREQLTSDLQTINHVAAEAQAQLAYFRAEPIRRMTKNVVRTLRRRFRKWQ